MGEKYVTAPLVAGGVYRFTQSDGREVMGLLLGTRQNVHGKLEGRMYRIGYPEFLAMENDEGMLGWDLVATPTFLEEPIRSDRLAATEEELRVENQRLSEELEDLRQRISALEDR